MNTVDVVADLENEVKYKQQQLVTQSIEAKKEVKLMRQKNKYFKRTIKLNKQASNSSIEGQCTEAKQQLV